MKYLLIIFILLFTSCISQKVYLQKVKMKPIARVVELDFKHSLVVLMFECDNPPFRNQPCYRNVAFDLDYFKGEYLEVGETVDFRRE